MEKIVYMGVKIKKIKQPEILNELISGSYKKIHTGRKVDIYSAVLLGELIECEYLENVKFDIEEVISGLEFELSCILPRVKEIRKVLKKAKEK